MLRPVTGLVKGKSFRTKSTKTRIETCDEIAGQGRVQIHSEQNPLKQGLKPNKYFNPKDFEDSFRTKSTKTRIETNWRTNIPPSKVSIPNKIH